MLTQHKELWHSGSYVKHCRTWVENFHWLGRGMSSGGKRWLLFLIWMNRKGITSHNWKGACVPEGSKDKDCMTRDWLQCKQLSCLLKKIVTVFWIVERNIMWFFDFGGISRTVNLKKWLPTLFCYPVCLFGTTLAIFTIEASCCFLIALTLLLIFSTGSIAQTKLGATRVGGVLWTSRE